MSRRSCTAAVIICRKVLHRVKLPVSCYLVSCSRHSLSRPDVATEICSKMKSFRFLSFLGLLIFAHIAYGAEKVEEKPLEEPNLSRAPDSAGTNEAKSETPTASTDENTSEDDKKYALGSLCNYCTYCKVGVHSCILCIASVLKCEVLAKVSDKPEVLLSSDPDQVDTRLVGVKLQFEALLCLRVVITPRF